MVLIPNSPTTSTVRFYCQLLCICVVCLRLLFGKTKEFSGAWVKKKERKKLQKTWQGTFLFRLPLYISGGGRDLVVIMFLLWSRLDATLGSSTTIHNGVLCKYAVTLFLQILVKKQSFRLAGSTRRNYCNSFSFEQRGQFQCTKQTKQKKVSGKWKRRSRENCVVYERV